MDYNEMLWVRPGTMPEDGLVQRPTKVVINSFWRRFDDLSSEELDSIGWNAAVPLTREPFTTYGTRWVKGDDLIYREESVTAVVDEEAKAEAEAAAVRTERDARLTSCDWTQMPDSPLVGDAEWMAYRQDLRDITDQDGFPGGVVWPEAPGTG